MHTGQFAYTSTAIVGIVFTALAFLMIALALVVAVFLTADDGGCLPLSVWFGSSLIIVGFIAWGWFPFEKKYHAYETITGTVSEVASRNISAGDKGGTNTKFVVRYVGSDQDYGCTDTRCALIKPGDHLTMKCVMEYEFNTSDGYDCKWGSRS